MSLTPVSRQSNFARSRSLAGRALIPLLLLLAPASVMAAFGLSDSGPGYIVDTGAGLVFTVSKTDGSITSIVYNGTEFKSTTGRTSHIASGLGSDTIVTADTDNATYVKITLQTNPTNSVVSNLTHYLIVRNGDNRIYMATYPTAEPAVGELRWITRLNSALVPNGPPPSNNTGNTGAIESSDVFGYADGTTTSKYYGDAVTRGKDRAMDMTYCGATGPGVGIWMIYGSRESSSGGPFFRDIQNQGGTDQEIYNYMNSGHNQTEPYRLNVLHGPYALAFTNGEAPAIPDYSWMEGLGLTGWVPAAGRGTVSGTATGIPAGFEGVVGFANASAQYWAKVDPATGAYTCTGIKPGVYAVTLYKGELAVATASATVAAGVTTPLNLASAEANPSTIFRIGEWDGTPAGLLNGEKIVQMHPSDTRMSPWTNSYTVGSSSPSAFPAIQFRGANSPMTITFKLAPNQAASPLVVRIGLTCAYNSGRPQVTVNSFTSPAPAASSQPSSRSFTIGTYRGNNALYTFNIPASALVAGTNTLTINPISGSSDLGTWLSAGWVYDAVEVEGPIATPAINYVGGNPLVISGTAEPGRTVTVTLDGVTVLGATSVSGTGNWSLTYGGGIAAGTHTLTAVADDGLGHTSPASSAFAFNPGVTMPVIDSAVGDTGTYTNGATTSDRVFLLSGIGGPGDTVTLTRVGLGAIGTATPDASGRWTFDYTGTSLPDGENSFYATASSGGNTSASSPVFTLNLAGQPRVAIVRFDPAATVVPTTIGEVTFRVAFNHSVSGVTPAAFALATTGTAVGTVAGVSASSGTLFDVTVDNLSGAGNLRLDLKPGAVVDGSGNPEAGFSAGQSYTLVAPTTGNGTWTNPSSGGYWSDGGNWLNAVIADGAGNSANFANLDLAADNTVHLDAPRALGSLVFGDTTPSTPAGWIVSSPNPAHRLTLAGATPTITVNAMGAGATVNLGAGLAGTAGFAKTGPGTLVLSGPSSLTGPVSLGAGTVQLVAGGSLDLGDNPVSTALNTQFVVAGGSFTTAGTVVATTSTMSVTGGTASLGGFRTNSDFGSVLRISGGIVTVGDVNLQRTSGVNPDFNLGLVVTGGITNAGTIQIGSRNSSAAASVAGGVLNASGVVTIGNQLTSGRGGALRVTGGTFTSTDTALGLLLCRNNGTNTNNVANATFTGGTSSVEKFTLGFDSAVTAGSATVTVNGGTLYLGSGGIVKNGASGLVTNLNFSSGTLGAKASWATSLPVNLPANGNVNFKAADAVDAPFTISLNGALGGAGGFTKTGAGTLTLGGAGTTHAYTGPTIVNGGTLRISSTLAAAANGVTVNNGATLAGNGTINRAIVLNGGARLAPDGAVPAATLTANSLLWNAGAVLAFDIGASGDRLALSGALTKGETGSYVFQLTPDASVGPGVFTLATFASTNFAAGDFAATGLPAGLAGRFVVTPTELRLVIHGPPVVTGGSASGMFDAPFSASVIATENPTAYAAAGLPSGLAIDPVTGVISGTPGAAGHFTVTLSATNAAGTGAAALELDIAPAPAVVTLDNLSQVYDGSPKSAGVGTTPSGLPVAVSYDGSASPPTNAGSYGVIAAILDPNYVGGATGTLVIAKAAATVTLGQLAHTYDGSPASATATTTPDGLAVTLTYDGNSPPPSNAGSYSVVATVVDDNYEGSASGTLVIAKAVPTIALNPLLQGYDGTPKPVAATTTPAGLPVEIKYRGGATVPIYPGSYEVTATVDDANHAATITDHLVITITALVRHAPTLNGLLDGSVQMASPESVTLNGNAALSGDLLVPGTPHLQRNGNALLVGTKSGLGGADPTGHRVTLNGNAALRYLVNRVDAISLPASATVTPPAGTRDVTISRPTDTAGDFATVRHLTLNGNAGSFALPAGAYGNVIVNGGSTLVLGSSGAGQAAVYDLQALTVNGNGVVQVAGPVLLKLATALTLNGVMGSAEHPAWLLVDIATGGLTLNGNAVLHGSVIAPNGTVTVNGNAVLRGQVSADRLTLNGNAMLAEPPK